MQLLIYFLYFFYSSLHICYHVLVHCSFTFVRIFSLSLPLMKALEVTFYLFFVYVSSWAYFSEQIKWTKLWKGEREKNQKKSRISNYIFLQAGTSLSLSHIGCMNTWKWAYLIFHWNYRFNVKHLLYSKTWNYLSP